MDYLKETIFNSLIAVGGTVVSLWLGGWDMALKVIVFLMIADYFTGVLSAFKSKALNSEVMFWGGIRKSVILLVVAISVMLDQLLGNESPVFRSMALWYYIAREGLSVVENLGILGVPLPKFITETFIQIQNKSGESSHNSDKGGKEL